MLWDAHETGEFQLSLVAQFAAVVNSLKSHEIDNIEMSLINRSCVMRPCWKT